MLPLARSVARASEWKSAARPPALSLSRIIEALNIGPFVEFERLVSLRRDASGVKTEKKRVLSLAITAT